MTEYQGQWPGPARAPAGPFPQTAPAAPFPQMAPRGVPEAVVAELRQLLFSSMPDTAIAHSYHVEALLDPALHNNAEFQRFSEVELNELHHQIAALGCLYRMQQGDPNALACLATNLQGFLENRRLAMQLAQQLPASVRQTRSVQSMIGHIQQTQQAVQRNMPLIQQFEAAVRAPSPGPLLVGPRPGAPIPY